jgi:spore coat protein H
MGLLERQLIIPSEGRNLLEKDLWSDQFVDAYLVSRGRRVPIKVRYRGGHTREYPKRSYEIVNGSTTLHLNAEYDDPSLIRNALSFQFFEKIGVPCSQTTHCHLIINGRSAGVYLELEAVDRKFFARRNIPVRSLFYAVNDRANFSIIHPDTGKRKSTLFKGYSLEIGNDTDRRRLIQFISKLNTLKGKSLYTYLESRLDIDNYLRWLAGAVFTGNYDGFDQNYSMYEHKNRLLFHIIPWDYEGTWGRNCFGKQVSSELVRITGYNRLTSSLLKKSNVRSKYKIILKDILDNAFISSRILEQVNRMYDQIAHYVYSDRERKWSTRVFDNEPQIIRDYIRERREIIARDLERL